MGTHNTNRLDSYGKIIRQYDADGTMQLNSGAAIPCSVHAIQVADGRIMATCLVSREAPDMASSIFKGDESLKSISASTLNSDTLLLEGEIIPFSANVAASELDILVTSMKYQAHAGDNVPSSARFGITNFESVIGNKVREHGHGWSRDVLELDVAGKKLEIHPVENHKNIIELVKHVHVIDVTSEAILQILSQGDMDTAPELIENVCKLLSFARGTKINWIYCDYYDNHGEKALSLHKTNVTRTYSGLALIDLNNPNDTASFVRQAYPGYLQRKDEYSLDIAIDSYLDAKIESVYLQTRALRAVVLMDFLKGRYAANRNLEFLLHKKHFKKVRRYLKSSLEAAREDLSLPDRALTELESKLGELNRRSFRAFLEEMFAELGIKWDDLDSLIKVRNSLVHRSDFVSNDYWHEYSLLISLLDRLLLRLLNYDGSFLDIADKFKSVATTDAFTETDRVG